MILSFALFGCTTVDPKDTAPEDTGYVFRDTSVVDDSAPVDTDSAVDTDTAADTDSSADTDTGGDTDTAAPSWLSIEVWPAAIAVHAGATWSLRVVGTDPDGLRGDLPSDTEIPTFSVDDPSVATVDSAGTVTALAEGTTTLRVTHGGLEATASVDVRADGVATITVLDGLSGAPIEGARVALPFTSPVQTDASGVALLPVTDALPITFSAWVDDTYDALTVTGVVGRALTVSILPKDTVARDATLTGAVDFAGVDDGGFSDIVVGFAGASIQGAFAATRLEDLFAEERAITVFGVDVEAPANLFIEGAADSFSATALPGPVAVWGLGGPIPIADATSSLSGTGDALALLAANMGAMSWGYASGLTGVDGAETVADLAPAARFDDTASISLPPLPGGFSGTEQYFLLVAEESAGEGYIITGLGSGAPGGPSEVPTVAAGTVADSLGTAVLAYAQVGGTGSGGATSTALATERSGDTILAPMLQDIATIDLWEPAARNFGYTADTDAHFVRVRFRDARNRVHDLYAPGSWSGTIPNAVSSFGLAGASIEVLALETSGGTFESWIATGALDIDGLPAVTAARTTQE